MTSFTEMIELELAENQTRRQWNWVRLPIKTLDGVKCDVRLLNFKGKCGCGTDCTDAPQWILKIETIKCCVMGDDGDLSEHEYYGYKIESLEKVKDILQSLRFNKFENRFQTITPIDWSFMESDTVKLKYDTCSVCLDKTVSKTDCGHYLCLPCYDKITENKDSETICPQCREFCMFEDGVYLGF